MPVDVEHALQRLVREDSGRVLAAIARRYGDIDLAEEALQEAMIEAAERWPSDGVPDNPPGWVYRVAQRRAVDGIRRHDAERRRRERAENEFRAVTPADEGPPASPLIEEFSDELPDERLRLILLCCHPALAPEAQIALTLRLVAGLTTEEIASAFLVSTSTMAARLTRAKKKIRVASLPLSIPAELGERVDAILGVIYLVFNEGYLSRTENEAPIRIALCDEAIRLADVLASLVPQTAEPRGLAALLRFIHARRDARLVDGKLVLLEEQDRRRWRLDEIRQANGFLAEAMQLMQPGPVQVEALIASHHSNARTANDTDWPSIVTLYDQLLALRPSPVVALNRAVAVGMADGPEAGLRELESVAGLDSYHLLHASRAEFARRGGDFPAARAALEKAIALADNPAEVALLHQRVALLGD